MLGLAQLGRPDEFKQRRDEIIEQYNAAFDDTKGIQTPPEPVDADPTYHPYAIDLNEALGCGQKESVNEMHAENNGTQVHYVSLHYYPYFREKFGSELRQFPETEAVYDRLVSPPLYAEMDDDDVADATTAVRQLLAYCHR